MPLAIDDTAARAQAVEAHLRTHLANRNVTPVLKHFTDHSDQELLEGVLTVVTATESDFKNQRGMIAKEGTTQFLLIAHLKIAETSDQEELAEAEHTLLSELKSAIRQKLPGLSLLLGEIQFSRQLDHPYGWFVATLDVGPPLASTS